MKALTVKQPWASLIAAGKKTIETRKWRTNYRGPILICAGRPDGRALCVVELLDCRPMRKEDWALTWCRKYRGAHAWVLGAVRRIKPFAVRGKPRLFVIFDEIQYL